MVMEYINNSNLNIIHFETSALNGKNVEQSIKEIATIAANTNDDNIIPFDDLNKITINNIDDDSFNNNSTCFCKII